MEEIILSSKRKWFWIGIILLIITPPYSVLVFGIALFIVEKKYRKVALTAMVLSLVLFAFYFAIAYFSLLGRATTQSAYSNSNTSLPISATGITPTGTTGTSTRR